MSEITFTIPPEALDQLREELKREAIAEVLEHLQRSGEPFMDTAAAAEYLSCGPQRIHTLVHERRIPFHKDGARLLFKRDELDAYLGRNG